MAGTRTGGGSGRGNQQQPPAQDPEVDFGLDILDEWGDPSLTPSHSPAGERRRTDAGLQALADPGAAAAGPGSPVPAGSMEDIVSSFVDASLIDPGAEPVAPAPPGGSVDPGHDPFEVASLVEGEVPFAVASTDPFKGAVRASTGGTPAFGVPVHESPLGGEEDIGAALDDALGGFEVVAEEPAGTDDGADRRATQPAAAVVTSAADEAPPALAADTRGARAAIRQALREGRQERPARRRTETIADDEASAAPVAAGASEPIVAPAPPAAAAPPEPAAPAPAAPAAAAPAARRGTASTAAAAPAAARATSSRRAPVAPQPPPEPEPMLEADDAVIDEPTPAQADPEPEPEAEPEPATWMNDQSLFKKQSQDLMRKRDWSALAALTAAALDTATWARVTEVRTGLLLDLAGIHRDRLKDTASAEDVFVRLAREVPANPQAIDYLSEVYERREEWQALHDLYAAAVEPCWDPGQRLEWTRSAVRIARDHLSDPQLPIQDWERLWRLGDAVEEAFQELTRSYRLAGRWAALGDFLHERAQHLEGVQRVAALREVAEIYLSGLRAEDRAAGVLNEILALRPGDPIALLALARVLAHRGDWGALEELSNRSHGQLPRAVLLDFRRLVADALWQSDRLEEAVEAYARVLELDPEDKDALGARESYLVKSQKYEALVEYLQQRAAALPAGAEHDAQRCALYERAARLAEKELDNPQLAQALWESRVGIDPNHLPGYQALAEIYESLGDLAGVARSLETQVQLTKDPLRRVELLRRLGEHYAHRMGDDTRAEQCWKKMIAVVPGDMAVREELVALHRRRGDFESLDSALARQIWIANDPTRALELSRMAAKNLDDHVNSPDRSIDAWYRVLDYAPADHGALEALAAHYAKLGRKRDLIAVREEEVRAITEPGARLARALEVARLWHAEGAQHAAVASYERALFWDVVNSEALGALVQLCGGADAGKAIGTLEVASAFLPRPEERIALLRTAAGLLPEADKVGRFAWQRRVLALSGGYAAYLTELAGSAEAADRWPQLAAVYLHLASRATDPGERLAYHQELARLYEHRLKDQVRAFLVLHAVGTQPGAHEVVLSELHRMAHATGRVEDYLAVVDTLTTPAFPLASRQARIRERAQLCEQAVKDAGRAFEEQRRLLDLDADDEAALAELHRLAEAYTMWRELDDVYGELWDRAGENRTAAAAIDRRVAIARARHQIRKTRLSDASGALDQLMEIFRLNPANAGVLDELLAAAEELSAWARVLPTIEAAYRAAADRTEPAALVRLASLYEDKLADPERALELYAEAYVLDPRSPMLPARLERLAEATGRWERLAQCFRVAAARGTGSEDDTLDLYRRIAHVYEQKLNAPDRAHDIHLRILRLRADAIPSLEVIIDSHRRREEWRDLRDRLRQWLKHAPADTAAAVQIDRWLEIARLSHPRLHDPEEALSAYAAILDLDSSHAEAVEGIASLTAAITDPALQLRRMQIELHRAPPAGRGPLLLDISRLQVEQLDNAAAGEETLRTLVAESGPDGPGYEPLAKLYTARGAWGELASLIEARAEKIGDAPTRLATLDEALAVCDTNLLARGEIADASPAGQELNSRVERLCRKILADRPDDRRVRHRVMRLLRAQGRWDELAQLLESALTAIETAEGEITDEQALERLELQRELAHVLYLGLGRASDAEGRLREILDFYPDDDDAALLLARLLLTRKDLNGYVSLRKQQARRLPGPHAALVFCHLAEALDEQPGDPAKAAQKQTQLTQLYREARQLDTDCVPAMEAMKAVGRRLKNWRQTSSLLPDADEAKLSWPERASRLTARGDAARADDPLGAINWYQRALAVEPDHLPAWEALTALRLAEGDKEQALLARLGALSAYERQNLPSADKLNEYVGRIHQAGEAAAEAGDTAAAQRAWKRAYDLSPDFAPAALVIADQLAQADLESGHKLYDRALRDQAHTLNAEQLKRATYQRGALAHKLGRYDAAIEDLKATLKLDPLHASALMTMADVLASQGRVAAAIQSLQQSLLVVLDPERRGQLYLSLGRLWEDHLSELSEAGVCYDLAIAEGARDRDLMLRAQRHYNRTGQHDRALEVIDALMPQTEDPKELASLWVARGEIYSSQPEEQGAQAVEAYDMALSYDPGKRQALDGLARVLEARGDWAQLIEVLEARSDPQSPVEERAEAMRRMARICTEQLRDAEKAEKYLRQSVELQPSREGLEELLGLYADLPSRGAQRAAVLGRLVGFGPPYYRRMVDLARLVLEQGKRRWAWCLLSPLVSVTSLEPEVKAAVAELRKEFEKIDNLAGLSGSLHEKVRDPRALPQLTALLADLGELVKPLGRTMPEDVGGGIGKVGEGTGVGKAFENVASQLGMSGSQLWRAHELSEAVTVLNSDTPRVVVKTELLQLISGPELPYAFSYALELTRPGVRVAVALPGPSRTQLWPAICAATGVAQAADPAARALADTIRQKVDAARLAEWAAVLQPLLAGSSPVDLGERWWTGVVESARRVALVAAPDCRLAARMLSRMHDDLPKPRMVARVDELDAGPTESTCLRDLCAFAASPELGALL